ncbi:MAG: hypothetical protein CV089_23775 [Nitrospira sp. WS110]|nr:hypothetical protein [Nitrospira sp. WS110]
MPLPHIIDWRNFFEPHFSNQEEAASFVATCDPELNRDRQERINRDNTLTLMMHQTVRLVGYADQTPNLRPWYDPLRLLFLLVCAECVKKLHHRYKDDGQSKDHVRRFFADHVADDDKAILRNGISVQPPDELTDRQIVDILYALRCDVVHEGRFWGFSFATDDCPILNPNPLAEDGRLVLTVGITFTQLRDIVVRRCINAMKKEIGRQEA